jgi:hypothetical protein
LANSEAGGRVRLITLSVCVRCFAPRYALMRDVDCFAVPLGVRTEVCAGFEVNYGTAWHALKDLGRVSGWASTG